MAITDHETKRTRHEHAGKDAPESVAGVSISHPYKAWWPDTHINKIDVAHFYDRISPRLLRWVADRPLVAERCPDGMVGTCFFQKNFAGRLPRTVPTVSIPAESTGRTVTYVVGGSAETLLVLVNLGCIAIHTMNCRTGSLQQPDWLAFDLDPGPGGFADAARAGDLLRRILDGMGLRSYPKTSGARGLHVFVPIQTGPDQETVRAFARRVAERMTEEAPDLVTIEALKRARKGRVYIDIQRNAFGQTIVAPYSVRRRPGAAVSTPLSWDEATPELEPGRFNLRTIENRLVSEDPWVDFWEHRQELPAL